MTTNPYQTPKAPLARPAAPRTEQLGQPKAVAASHGWSWLRQGFDYFKSNPGTWILVLIIWLAILFGVGLVPVLGSLFSTVIGPIMWAGFVVGCDAIHRGEPLDIKHVFAGFSKNTGQLVLVAVIYFIGIVGIFAIAGAILFLTAGTTQVMSMIQNSLLASTSPATLGLLAIPLLCALLLAIPLAMAYWYAPALVVLHNLSATQAMGLSFKGCLRNILPFLVYSIAAMVLAIVALIPLGLGYLVVGPMMIASLYISYREIFLA